MKNFNYEKYLERINTKEINDLINAIYEFKGKVESLEKIKAKHRTKFKQIATNLSIYSSNELESIRTSATRFKKIIQNKESPKTKSEEEILGYKKVLETIFESYQYIPLNLNIILQLHRDLYSFVDTNIGGKTKITQNYIVKKTDDYEEILFTPLFPAETPDALKKLCEQFNFVKNSNKLSILILIPIFINDFLAIHPFLDGNGRLSRLLTTLLLLQNGFQIPLYTSLENLILETKSLYYAALQKSQTNWIENNEDPYPFVIYFLKLVFKAYQMYFAQLEHLSYKKDKNIETIKTEINNIIGKFTKETLVLRLPFISKSSIEKNLKFLVNENFIGKEGKGKATFYYKK